VVAIPDAVAAGQVALRRGDWQAAKESFEAALAVGDSDEALDGLGQALWWLNDAEAAIDLRQRAYVGLVRAGKDRAAARIALWLAHEYGTSLGNRAAANGWRFRVERLLEGQHGGAEVGLLELAYAEQATDLGARERHAQQALELGRSSGDVDLEVYALAQLGLTRVLLGRTDDGTRALDEAMAAATGGEVASLQAIGETCCTMLLACEEAGDTERLTQWCRVIDQFAQRHNLGQMFAFCRTLHAEVLARTGHVEEAERALHGALHDLEQSGHRARCVHPATRLADLCLAQGRIEEATRLIAGYREHPVALRTVVDLHLVRGEPGAAAALVKRRLDHVGSTSLLAAPLFLLLVRVELARPDLDAAASAVEQLAALVEGSGRADLRASTEFARARVALARGDVGADAGAERAIEAFTQLDLPLEAARARLELARAVADDRPQLAVAEAYAALAVFRRHEAARDADETAELLRRLGERPGTSHMAADKLTRRELEVLRLVAEGLTNAEIATRLFISPRTAEHHVSSILAKLGLRSRAEAAARAPGLLIGSG
jgi:DNA-binding CsgD family transcriptional regulator